MRTTAALLLVTLLLPLGAAAQDDVEALATACGEGRPGLTDACRETALAARAVQAGVGLGASLGSELPGSASTLGKRIGTMPHIGLAVRGGLVRFDVPDVLEDPNAPARATAVTAPVVQATADLGLFDGFALAPTVGGILSLDLLASGSFVLLSEDDGFGGSAEGYGVGARLGILRESFTLPGLTLSLTRRWMGDVAWGGEDRSASVDADGAVTSARATVGKDLLALGLVAGAGWDRFGGPVAISRTDPVSSVPGDRGAASMDVFTADWVLFYGGVSLTMLVLQLSAEGGWARGFDGPATRPAGDDDAFDPASSSLFGSVAARLTF